MNNLNNENKGYLEFDRKKLLPLNKNRLNYDNLSISEIKRLFALSPGAGAGPREENKHIKTPSSLSKGFRGYNVIFIKEGIDSNQSINITNCLLELFKGFESDRVYSLLFSIVDSESLNTVSLLPKSILVTNKSPVDILTNILIKYIIINESKYEISSSKNLVIQGRVWYSKEDLLNQVSSTAETDKDLRDTIISRKYESINKLVTKELDSLLNKEPNRGRVYLNGVIKKLIQESMEIRLTPSILDRLKVITGDSSYTLYAYKKKSKLEQKEVKLLCFHHSNKDIYQLMEGSYTTASWIDEDLGGDLISRKFDNNKILFSKKYQGNKILPNIKEIELGYKFNNFKQLPKNHIFDEKMGVIDLETFSCNEQGTQQVFAGGWAVRNQSKLYYLDEFENLDSKQLVNKLFSDIFNSEYSFNYTFFVHNLSSFDYIFILDSLTQDMEGFDKFKLTPVIKEDNTLVSLKISSEFEVENKELALRRASTPGPFAGATQGVQNNKTNKKIKQKRTITLLDSYLFLPAPLRKLALDFKCSVQKGIFPYKFVNKSNLLYKGELPDFKYFSNLNFEEYKNIYPEDYIFDVKSETLSYLSKDLTTLLEIMEKFANTIYNNFSINITSCKTISGLSLYIFLSNFFDFNLNIKEIKGGIEKEIRTAYYGGLVVLNKKGKLISKDKPAYYYDFNSFYPSLMLKPMPVGNPTLSSSKDLDSYFGFCYVQITPPEGLDNYLIPYRDSNGKVYCPSTPFSGLYWSELLKASREYGYKIQVSGGFKFEKGYDVFKPFIRDIYEKRSEAKENSLSSLQYVFKLIMNSLYGRFGMKEIENKLEIVDRDKADILLKNKNITFYHELPEKYIIRYNKDISPKFMKQVNSQISPENQNYLANLFKQRGVSSSIAIAAAITSYALTELMTFKNMPSNKLIYSDTDSIIMENPLNSELISPTELGKLKLEHVITEGYFIAPKFYGFTDVEGKTIIRTKGVNKGKIVYADLIKLSQGKDIHLKTTVFVKNLKEGTVNIRDQDYLIKGVGDVELNQ
uniref:DNA polymerase n=1 Tax=Termitomyces sp. K1Aa TaxID=2724994 RepID=A0A8F1ABZ4_9AGAR|nr:DNA polymerase [Termitomyces sp. K1Aa]